MSEAIIKVEGVSKKYCRTIKHTMLYGATDLTKSFFSLKPKSEKLRNGEFWALDNISFELKQGETLGIIGPNGSGKSTLLKLLNGIFMPDRGRIDISGRVGALIEVGAGFHPMLTGRENIYVNGSILGMTKNEIDDKFDEIVDFSEIKEFIDSPVKHYSSGMYVRLGFAIAAHCNVDILLIDEVLAVGDLKFVLKCHAKIAEMRKKGISSIVVSHNVNYIRNICSNALLINKSKLIAHDNAIKVCDHYEREQTHEEQIIKFREEKVIQKVDAEVDEYVKFDLTINDRYKDRDNWILIVGIKSASGHMLVNESLIGFFKEENNSFSFYNQLRPGFYSLTLHICDESLDNVVEWNEDFFKFDIPGSAGFSKGLIRPRIT